MCKTFRDGLKCEWSFLRSRDGKSVSDSLDMQEQEGFFTKTLREISRSPWIDGTVNHTLSTKYLHLHKFTGDIDTFVLSL